MIIASITTWILFISTLNGQEAPYDDALVQQESAQVDESTNNVVPVDKSEPDAKSETDSEPEPEPEPSGPPLTYQNFAQLSEGIQQFASDNADSVMVESYGTSIQGRELWALRTALPGSIEPDDRPAMLIVAGLDSRQMGSTEIALAINETLLKEAEVDPEGEASSFLTNHTLYVLPRANPDGAEMFFAPVRLEYNGNLKTDDADRDGSIDEDPPNDLNGDGMITMMRVMDLNDADMMADENEPRLSLEADSDKEQRASFSLQVEGLDDDGDGEINEDGVGGVDLNRNFTHGHKEHQKSAGAYPLSEAESMALIKYVLARQNIAIVVTYGGAENLASSPKSNGTYKGGTPKTILDGDAGMYDHIGERYRELTGNEQGKPSDANGAFYAWSYAEFGVPSFATNAWPGPDKNDKNKTDENADESDDSEEQSELTPSGIGDISSETIEELRAHAETRGFQMGDEMMANISPEMIERFAGRAGITIQRVKTKGGKASDADAARWLAYSDEERDGEGFVEWEAFEHPELGPIEIGGWAPYFRSTPPAADLRLLADKQVPFILDLAKRFPDVSLSEPEIKPLAPGLWEVKVSLINDGYLPTGTAMAKKNRRARPYVVRLSTPIDSIISGARVHKIWALPGSGGRHEMRWIIEAEDGSEITISVFSEKFGEFDQAHQLADNQSKESDS